MRSKDTKKLTYIVPSGTNLIFPAKSALNCYGVIICLLIEIDNEVGELTPEQKNLLKGARCYSHTEGLLIVSTTRHDIYWSPANAIAAIEYLDQLQIKELK